MKKLLPYLLLLCTGCAGNLPTQQVESTALVPPATCEINEAIIYCHEYPGFGGGERLKLLPDGTYMFSVGNCMQHTYGYGCYTIHHDTIIMNTFKSASFPIDITQSYDRQKKDSFFLKVNSFSHSIISHITINDTITAYQAINKQPYYIIYGPFPKRTVKKLCLYYKDEDNDTLIHELTIPVGKENIVTIATNMLNGYHRPLQLRVPWIILDDAIYPVKLGYRLKDCLKLPSLYKRYGIDTSTLKKNEAYL